MAINEQESIWVVTAYWELASEPVVSLWDNAEAAEKNYEYLLNVFGEKHVHLSCLPVNSTFIIGA